MVTRRHIYRTIIGGPYQGSLERTVGGRRGSSWSEVVTDPMQVTFPTEDPRG